MIDGAGRPADRLHRRTAARWVELTKAGPTPWCLVWCLVLYLGTVGCSERSRGTRLGTGAASASTGSRSTGRASTATTDDWWRNGAPDESPQMVNSELPFRYPVTVFRRRQQGNVLLRLYVDASGTVIPDSSRVAQPSGEPLLDSAALAGSALLRFRPARRRGVPIAVVMLFPVHFRHPGEPRLAGDSL